MSSLTETFSVAEHIFRLVFTDTSRNSMALLPSLLPFRTDNTSEPLLFELIIDDNLQPIAKEQRERIRAFETGNGETIVDQIKGGGYQYIFKNNRNEPCCLLQCDEKFQHCKCALNGHYNMRCFGLSNALMLTYAYASSYKQTLLIHASLVRHHDKGYAFIAKSGTGKSTQVSSWLRYIPDCNLMNDDNPIIRVIDQKVFIYGGPWSGKTPCYRNVKAELGAITRIDRAQTNSIDREDPISAFASFLPSCASMKWDEAIYRRTGDIIAYIVERIPIYTLHCLPDKEAAILCHQTITR